MHRIVLYLFAISTLFISCGDRNPHPVPYVPVNEVVYLSTPSGYPLQFVGGTVVLPDAGVRGIVVYRRTLQENVDDFKKMLYENIKEVHTARFPYNDFLYIV